MSEGGAAVRARARKGRGRKKTKNESENPSACKIQGRGVRKKKMFRGGGGGKREAPREMVRCGAAAAAERAATPAKVPVRLPPRRRFSCVFLWSFARQHRRDDDRPCLSSDSGAASHGWCQALAVPGAIRRRARRNRTVRPRLQV